jgi:hypothetical protein
LAASVGSSRRDGSVFRKRSLPARIRAFLERLRRRGKGSLDRRSRKRLPGFHRSLPTGVQAGGREPGIPYPRPSRPCNGSVRALEIVSGHPGKRRFRAHPPRSEPFRAQRHGQEIRLPRHGGPRRGNPYDQRSRLGSDPYAGAYHRRDLPLSSLEQNRLFRGYGAAPRHGRAG